MYEGRCANRGVTIFRRREDTWPVVEEGKRFILARCNCGLHVFMEGVLGRDDLQPVFAEDDYRGADHE